MTGRRSGERRTSTRAHFVVASDDKRSDGDRREFLRRFTDLGAEIEAHQKAGDREVLMSRLRCVLADRGVKA